MRESTNVIRNKGIIIQYNSRLETHYASGRIWARFYYASAVMRLQYKDRGPTRRIMRLDDMLSQGAKRNFTYLFEGQIHFAFKLSVECPI